MELTYYINKYGHKMVKCPFCPKECYVREGTRSNPNPLCNLMRHIGVEAKNEALETFTGKSVSRMDDEPKNFLHLRYYIDHTAPLLEPKRVTRRFDDSLSLSN